MNDAPASLPVRTLLYITIFSRQHPFSRQPYGYTPASRRPTAACSRRSEQRRSAWRRSYTSAGSLASSRRRAPTDGSGKPPSMSSSTARASPGPASSYDRESPLQTSGGLHPIPGRLPPSQRGSCDSTSSPNSPGLGSNSPLLDCTPVTHYVYRLSAGRAPPRGRREGFSLYDYT